MKKLYLLLLSINLLGVAAAHSEEALSVSSSPIKGALHLLQGRGGNVVAKESIIENGLGEKWSSWGKGFIKEKMWINTIAAGQ